MKVFIVFCVFFCSIVPQVFGQSWTYSYDSSGRIQPVYRDDAYGIDGAAVARPIERGRAITAYDQIVRDGRSQDIIILSPDRRGNMIMQRQIDDGDDD